MVPEDLGRDSGSAAEEWAEVEAGREVRGPAAEEREQEARAEAEVRVRAEVCGRAGLVAAQDLAVARVRAAAQVRAEDRE